MPLSFSGVDDKLGSIEAGKLADIVAVKGNPIDDIRAMENMIFVMKNGKIYKQPQQKQLKHDR